MLISYNWLKDYIGEAKLTAKEAADLLGKHAFEIEGVEEREEDTVIDIDILPNRSSDALCHRGIARELASITSTPLSHDPLSKLTSLTSTDSITVSIEDIEACPRFTASLVTGITVKESPEWLQERLRAIGQRPINNIVDATNYVMYAIGQPLHAYDADLFPKVDGKWQFQVRFAKENETISLLAEGGKPAHLPSDSSAKGTTRGAQSEGRCAGKDEDRIVELQGTELLIVDQSSDTPIGLAGVKGGRFAGVHEGTKNIIIEAAHFHPTVTRKTARRLGIVIDASKRFENEPSRELPPYAQNEIIQLITDIAGGACEGVLDEYITKQVSTPVTVTVSKTNSLLGLELSIGEIKEIILRTGSVISEENEDSFVVTGPWERTDLNIEEDFIEEVGRLHGYDHITTVLDSTSEPPAEYNKRHYYCEIMRHTLIEIGFSEVITSSFRKKDKIQLQNALASDKSYLRSTLSKNIADALDKNVGFADLLGATDTRLFEIGTVFYKGDGSVDEHVSLAIGVRLKSSGYSKKEDVVIEKAINSLQEKLGVELACTNEKGIVEINVTELLDKLPDPTVYEPVMVGEEVAYEPFSLFPHVSRDIALWVSEGTTITAVEEKLAEQAGPLHKRTTLFDEFTKDGRTSFAFRLVFQSSNKTLTDEEVNTVMDKINATVAEEGWEVR